MTSSFCASCLRSALISASRSRWRRSMRFCRSVSFGWIMDPMMELVNALNALTAALQKFTSQTTNAYLDTFEEIYNPEKDEPQAAEAPKEQPTPKQEEATVTFVQFRSRLSEISRVGHTQEVKELIAKYSASKLSDIAESDYAAVLAEAEGL